MRVGYQAWRVFLCNDCSFLGQNNFSLNGRKGNLRGRKGSMRVKGDMHGSKWISVMIDGRMGDRAWMTSLLFIYTPVTTISQLDRREWSIEHLGVVRFRAEKCFLSFSCTLAIELFGVALLAFCFRATAPLFHRYCAIVSSAVIHLAYIFSLTCLVSQEVRATVLFCDYFICTNDCFHDFGIGGKRAFARANGTEPLHPKRP